MCRSIKVLRSSEPVSPEDIEAAALQFVRKISGMRKPSQRNEAIFLSAVNQITSISQQMLEEMGPSNRRPTVGSVVSSRAAARVET